MVDTIDLMAIVQALIAAPIHHVVETALYYYGLMLVIENVAQTFGISSKSVDIAMFAGEAPTWVISTVSPAVYLAIGLGWWSIRVTLSIHLNIRGQRV